MACKITIDRLGEEWPATYQPITRDTKEWVLFEELWLCEQGAGEL